MTSQITVKCPTSHISCLCVYTKNTLLLKVKREYFLSENDCLFSLGKSNWAVDAVNLFIILTRGE